MKTHDHLLLLALLAGCGDRTVTSDEDGPPPPPPDVAEPAGSEGDSEGEVICRDGLVACDGKCISVTENDEHCGVCGHACKDPYFFGHCEQASCPSAHWCAAKEQGLENCDDVCAFHGQRCDEGPRELSRGCGGGYILHFDSLDNDALYACIHGPGSDHGVHATCSTPFDWSITGGWEEKPATAVACCCTQEPA